MCLTWHQALGPTIPTKLTPSDPLSATDGCRLEYTLNLRRISTPPRDSLFDRSLHGSIFESLLASTPQRPPIPPVSWHLKGAELGPPLMNSPRAAPVPKVEASSVGPAVKVDRPQPTAEIPLPPTQTVDVFAASGRMHSATSRRFAVPAAHQPAAAISFEKKPRVVGTELNMPKRSSHLLLPPNVAVAGAPTRPSLPSLPLTRPPVEGPFEAFPTKAAAGRHASGRLSQIMPWLAPASAGVIRAPSVATTGPTVAKTSAPAAVAGDSVSANKISRVTLPSSTKAITPQTPKKKRNKKENEATAVFATPATSPSTDAPPLPMSPSPAAPPTPAAIPPVGIRTGRASVTVSPELCLKAASPRVTAKGENVPSATGTAGASPHTAPSSHSPPSTPSVPLPGDKLKKPQSPSPKHQPSPLTGTSAATGSKPKIQGPSVSVAPSPSAAV